MKHDRRWMDGGVDWELICDWINIFCWENTVVLVALCRGDVSLQQVQKVYTGKEENVVSECSRIHSATELRLEQSVTSFQRTSPKTQRPAEKWIQRETTVPDSTWQSLSFMTKIRFQCPDILLNTDQSQKINEMAHRTSEYSTLQHCRWHSSTWY